MHDQDLQLIEGAAPVRVGAKQFAEIGLRWRRRMIAVFLLTVLCGLAGAYSFREYESVMKILVRRERADPIVTPDQASPEREHNLSEAELNVEVDLLRSDDVLRQVVKNLKLDDKVREPLWYRLSRARTGTSEEVRTTKATQKLYSNLDITLPRQSNIITVRYGSERPRVASDVLNALAHFYLEKHMAVRRPRGQFRFFEEQAERYRQELAEVETQLARFPYTEGAVAGPMELELEVKSIAELRMQRQQALTAVTETQRRLTTLERQLSSTPSRMTTAVRSADNAQLITQLRTTLLDLQLQRGELLKKFKPSYREVRDLERQIEQTEDAVAAAETSPARDETTDRDPTYEWLRAERAKTRADLDALLARATSLGKLLSQRQRAARTLNETSLRQQNLLRKAKTLEERYQLYMQKREEARMGDALDRQNILNVSIIQPPTIPVLPKRSPWLLAAAGLIIAVLLCIGTAVLSEYLDDTIRSAEEVQRYVLGGHLKTGQ